MDVGQHRGSKEHLTACRHLTCLPGPTCQCSPSRGIFFYLMQLEFYNIGRHRAVGTLGDAAFERNFFSCTKCSSSSSSPSCTNLGRCFCVKGRSTTLPSPAGSSTGHISLGKSLICWDFGAPATLPGLFQPHCSPETPTGARGCTRTQSWESPSLAQLGTATGGGRKSPFTGAWSPAKLDPNQPFFFFFFPTSQ